MWLPVVTISTLEPHFDVNHGRVESSKDTISLESQPLDMSDQLNSWSDKVVRLQSLLTPMTTSLCSTNSTRMGDGRRVHGDPFATLQVSSVPPVEKHQRAS